MSNQKFTLEYSEAQGCFHLNGGNHQKDTNGYKTVLDNITYEEYELFKNSIKGRKITYAFLIKEADKFNRKRF